MERRWPAAARRGATLAATLTVVAIAAIPALPAGSDAAPGNDGFAAATVLVGPSGSLTGTNVLATKEAGEPDHAGTPGGASVWYRWTATTDGTLTVDTFGADFDTVLAAYTGTTVDALTPVVANDDDGDDVQSRIGPWTVTAGTTYLVALDGFPGAAQTGAITLHWSFAAVTAPLAPLPAELAP